MPHIIDTIRNKSLKESIDILTFAHDDLLKAIRNACNDSESSEQWGINMKRLIIDLTSISNPLVTKESEKFVELINILATVERTLDTLKWLLNQFPTLMVNQCHPSTSDDSDGNDIVLKDFEGTTKIRVEVCDVASKRAAQNNKEKSDIKNLGCDQEVPDDGVQRYIATSSEFSKALHSSKRKWASMCYKYETILISGTSTVLLKVLPS